MTVPLRLLLPFALAASLAHPARAASFLDDYLHNIRIDQQTAPRSGSREDWKSRTLEAPHTFGQTFTTGPDVIEIYQIMAESPNSNEAWGKGTSLVMALYDGPEKTNKLAEFDMRYEWRSWEDMMMVFPMRVKAEPNHTYYFELRAEGGNGVIGPIMIAQQDYEGGTAYIDGRPQDFDFIFQDYVHTQWDRDKTYEEQFNKLNLDYPPLAKVKAAVQAKDWDTAAKELVAHFESRPDLVDPNRKKPGSSPRPDFRLADIEPVLDMTIKDADGNPVSLGPNWNHLRWWPTRGGIGLTRSGIRKDFAAGYTNTGDERWAKGWNDMLKAVFIDLPSPLKSGALPPDIKETPPVLPGGIAGGSMWAGLSIGARMGHGFAYYAQFVDSPNFTWDVRAAFIMNLVDMAEVLAVEKGGGNWATQMTDSLFDFGRTYPEFRRSKEFFQIGYDGLIQNMRDTLSPDGPIGESSGYQGLVHGRYVKVPQDARNLGLPFPEDVYKQIELALQFHMYTSTPDGHMPSFGDGNPDISSRDLLEEGAKEFKRDDMLWVATNGKQGTKPAHTSFEFPYSKYYVMRSDWSPNARYLCLKNGGYTAHGHRDSLGFVLWAGGNQLLMDPGVYIYGTPEAIRMGGTASHCSITVDGQNLQNGGGPNRFFIGDSADLLYAEGPSYDGLPDSIRPVRRIAFLKPDYWVFSDVVRGQGEHQVESHFHYASKDAGLAGGTAVTTYEKGANLAIIPAEPKRVSSELVDGDVAGQRERLTPAYILKQSARARLPFRMDNVLYPFSGTTPAARVTALPVTEGAGPEASAVAVTTAKGTDYVAFTAAPGRKLACGKQIRSAAQMAVVRADKRGAVRSFSWMWGTGLVSNGRLLAVSKQLVPGLDVSYRGDAVYIRARNADPSLRVAKLNAKRYYVDTKGPYPIKAKNALFAPCQGQARDCVLVDDETPGFAIEKDIVGGNAGGEDQVGFTYHMCHVSPGRQSLMSWTPVLPKPGVYEVSVFVPHTSNGAGATKEAHYAVHCEPGSLVEPAGAGGTVTSVDSTKAADGQVDYRMDQQKAAGRWVSLGRYRSTAKQGLKLSLQADGAVRGPLALADAARFTFVKEAKR